ncbi:penicillin-binding protein 2 [Candidatus Sororendozoicomonas aggregata]|uniref:penicillin-binding protein 2 n=1 Tax=Candidatus Sororendozoicomonas aggregata TaxID=3073239 RepID=UPI002ED1963C
MPADAFKDHKAEARLVNTRVWIAVVLMLLLVCGLISRLFYLQVIRHSEMSVQSDENRVHLRPIPPTRGLIYDANGKLLAMNRSSRILSIVSERVEDTGTLLDTIGSLIPLSDSEIESYQRRTSSVRPFEPVPLKFDLTDEEMALISVNQFRLPGVELNAELVRYYPEGKIYAHSVGYVGRINDREIQTIDSARYSGTHSIGKIGLEKYYEDILMGEPGYKEVETNAQGRVVRVLKEVPPTPGKDLQLYLNTYLQKVALEAIGDRRGAAIAMDPKTGGVMVMVSNPSFDPNLFVTGIDYKTYNDLNTSMERPLYNRASLGEYPPASTVKPIMGLALLSEGLVKASDRVYDNGYFQIPGSSYRFRNWKREGHGWVNLRDAIILSNDVYFYNQASKLGIDGLHDFVSQFGYGRETGIDIGEERPGLLPSRAWKREHYDQPWYPGETVNAIIGQGYMLTTPVQMVESTAIIANRGKHVIPTLVKSEKNLDKPSDKDVNLGSPKNWELIIDAMEHVVSSPRGTAHWSIGRNIKYTMAAKTGTAQVVSIPQGEKYDAEKLKMYHRDHSLFIAFAPVDDPQIAISVVLENSKGAANVARKIADAYLLPKLEEAK